MQNSHGYFAKSDLDIIKTHRFVSFQWVAAIKVQQSTHKMALPYCFQ